MEIVEAGGLTLAGIRVVGRRSELAHRAPMAWLELTRRLAELPGARTDRFYGVFRDEDHGDAGTYRYHVCVEAQGALPEGFVALEIPRGRFAKATVRGGPEAIEAAYLSLARGIAERGGPGEGYGYELYEASRQSVTPPYERFDYDVFRPLAVG